MVLCGRGTRLLVLYNSVCFCDWQDIPHLKEVKAPAGQPDRRRFLFTNSGELHVDSQICLSMSNCWIQTLYMLAGVGSLSWDWTTQDLKQSVLDNNLGNVACSNRLGAFSLFLKFMVFCQKLVGHYYVLMIFLTLWSRSLIYKLFKYNSKTKKKKLKLITFNALKVINLPFQLQLCFAQIVDYKPKAGFRMLVCI